MGIRRRQLTIAALALPSVVVVALFAPRFVSPSADPSALLQDAGYLLINPPSRFHGPGTLNTVEKTWYSNFLGSGSLHLHPTCELNEDDLLQISHESETVDQRITERLSQSIDVRSILESKLESKAAAKSVKSIHVTFENMRILLMSHEKLLELQEKLLAGSCERAVLYNINSGGRVCQTQAVLQADLIYTIEYQDGLSSSQQLELTKQIASEINLEGGHGGTNQITGNGLYYGIRLMPRCIELNDFG